MLRLSLLAVIIPGMIVVPASAGALHDAAENGDTAAIAAALDAGADVNGIDRGGVPLFFAARNGQLEAARLLIERGADVNATSKFGQPLAVAVLRNRSEIIALILENGADPNALFQGEPMLHFAATSGCLKCVEALVEAGADVNAVWLVGAPDQLPAYNTPLHLARTFDHPDVADYLLNHGVTILTPQPITPRLATADAGEGQKVFQTNCAPCHFVREVQGHYAGPNLWGVVGRQKASTTFFNYSATMKAWGGTWTYEDLNVLIAGPTLTKPGLEMDVRGVPDEADRADVIAYLRTLSADPVPLP